MVDKIWEQIDPTTYFACHPRETIREPTKYFSPLSSTVSEEIKKMCETAHHELDSVPEANYLKSLIQQRENLWAKTAHLVENKSTDEKMAVMSYIGANMNGSYGRKAEDKILDMFEALTSVNIQRHPVKNSRTFHFMLNDEMIDMTLFGTPDGLLDTGTDSFRIIECKAKMGNGKVDRRFIKDYLQAISYQMIYANANDARPLETILLSHFELAKTTRHIPVLTLEDRTLSQWFMESMMHTEEMADNCLDTQIIGSVQSQPVPMPAENQAGLLRILHICARDAQVVWNGVMQRIWMLLTVVLTIVHNENWQQSWLSTRDKSVWLDDALKYIPQFYSMNNSVHA